MQKDYLERVYAGFLGMNVGIRLGAPVEPNIWSYERIKETYGDIPVFITENGIGVKPLETLEEDLNDQYRIDYLREHIRELNRCVRAGINLQGYFVWTFLDTYEGNSGAYLYRFGMVQIVPETKQRRPRRSFEYYKEIIRSNQVH